MTTTRAFSHHCPINIPAATAKVAVSSVATAKRAAFPAATDFSGPAVKHDVEGHTACLFSRFSPARDIFFPKVLNEELDKDGCCKRQLTAIFCTSYAARRLGCNYGNCCCLLNYLKGEIQWGGRTGQNERNDFTPRLQFGHFEGSQ